MDWGEFRKKEKIFVGDYDKIPEGCMWLEDFNVNLKIEEFENLIKKIEQAGIKEYKISPLTDEDGEYAGCFLESVTIGDITFSAHLENPAQDDEESGYAELLMSRKEKRRL